MKPAVTANGPEDLSADLLELLIDECEHALLLVESRLDETGRRVRDGEPPDEEGSVPLDVAELRLAIAELVDSHPGIAYDLERVGERVRTAGAFAAASEFAAHAHLLDLARLGLESFFRVYPSLEVYEAADLGPEFEEDVGRNPNETYQALSQLRLTLRSRLS